jgi:hypothetical protein
MSPTNGPGPECAPDLIPTCCWDDSCDLLLVPGGCITCDFTLNVARDEDGEPYPYYPFAEMPEPLP